MADLREYATYYGTDANFDEPSPDLGVLATEYEPNPARASGILIARALGRRVTSPTVIATLILGETDHIVFLHRPTMYRLPGPLHTLAITVWGNAGHECMPYVLDPTAFLELPPINTVTHLALAALLNGGADHVGPYPDGTHGNAEAVTVRKAIVLPGAWAARAVEHTTMTFLEFYNAFLLPTVGTVDEAQYLPWFTSGRGRPRSYPQPLQDPMIHHAVK